MVVFRKNNTTKPAHAVPLASARKQLDVETQAGHSSERAVEGPLELECGTALGSCRLTGHQPNRTRLRGAVRFLSWVGQAHQLWAVGGGVLCLAPNCRCKWA